MDLVWKVGVEEDEEEKGGFFIFVEVEVDEESGELKFEKRLVYLFNIYFVSLIFILVIVFLGVVF